MRLLELEEEPVPVETPWVGLASWRYVAVAEDVDDGVSALEVTDKADEGVVLFGRGTLRWRGGDFDADGAAVEVPFASGGDGATPGMVGDV